MNWYRDLSNVEYFFISCFFILYLIYLGRTLWIAYQLRSTARSVVLKFILRSSYFALLIMALLDPSFGDTQGSLKAFGRDIMLVVDVSKSMDATDIQPSRLEKVKFELLKVIDNFSGDRFGLIVFAADAFVQAPLSFDKSSLRDLYIKTLSTRLFSESGTALFPALTLAFEKQATNLNRRNASKIIVLITDGEDFGNSESGILRKIRALGMHLFVVGIGTQNGSRLRTADGYLLDEDGNLVVSKLDRENLQSVATQARGNYFEINNIKNEFSNLNKAITNVQGTLVDQRKVVVEANKYLYFIVSALLLIAFDVLVVVRTLKI
ncbi:MAG: VWA domain-containing protein [Spirosomataceae bacterium]